MSGRHTNLTRFHWPIVVILLLLGFHAPADPVQPPLPADLAINAAAGREGLLIVKLRLENGEELPMVVDTGAPITLLDQSMIPKLGKRLDVTRINAFVGAFKAGEYAAPKIFAGTIPLQTRSNILVCELKKFSPDFPAVAGILGMDCMRHYCIQLDFAAGKMRFLDPEHLDTAALGKSYPLTLATDADSNGVEVRPVIRQPGLLGGQVTNIVIDVGNNQDGMTAGKEIKQHAAGSYSGGPWKRFKHFLAVKGLVNRAVALPGCTWDGNTYTNIAMNRAPAGVPDFIGLRFLARHLVTFDFPHGTMYLKQTSAGPLPLESKK